MFYINRTPELNGLSLNVRLTENYFVRHIFSEVPTSELTKLLGPLWTREQISKERVESVTVSIYREGDKSTCEN